MAKPTIPWSYSHFKGFVGYRRWEAVRQYSNSARKERLLHTLGRQREYLFIHIPKTAGVSLINAYSDIFGGARHSPALLYRIALGQKYFQTSPFAVVRNPWARLFSAYNFLMQGGLIEADRKMGRVLQEQCPTFFHFVKDWLPQNGVCCYMHFVPQHEFLCGWGNELLVPNILKLERLDNDWPAFAENMGVPVREIPRMNRGSTAKYREHYDYESIECVRALYQKDVDLLAYEYE